MTRPGMKAVTIGLIILLTALGSGLSGAADPPTGNAREEELVKGWPSILAIYLPDEEDGGAPKLHHEIAKKFSEQLSVTASEGATISARVCHESFDMTGFFSPQTPSA